MSRMQQIRIAGGSRDQEKLQPDVWLGIGVLLVLVAILVAATAWFMGGL